MEHEFYQNKFCYNYSNISRPALNISGTHLIESIKMSVNNDFDEDNEQYGVESLGYFGNDIEQFNGCSNNHHDDNKENIDNYVAATAINYADKEIIEVNQSVNLPSVIVSNERFKYIGLALKQWSAYLGHVLLSFVHSKTCKYNCVHTYNSTVNCANTYYCPCYHYHRNLSRHLLAVVAAAVISPMAAAIRNNMHVHNGYYYNYAVLTSRLASRVQGKDPSVDFTQEIVEESEDDRGYDELSDSAPPIELPPCELARLGEISQLVTACSSSPIKREKLAMAIENDHYIKKLLDVFRMCEDLNNMEGLHHLYDIFKNIFLLNKNALFELMFAEETIFDVVGCLEYDPSLKTPRRHRDYLKNEANFHEVIKIVNPELLSKIHQTYRVQYIQDIVLPTPSLFEDNNILSTLSSFIFFNKVEIVSLIQEDVSFLTDIFTELIDSKTGANRLKELVLFLKDFFTYSQTLQPQSRETFFKTLSNFGIMPALELTLKSDNIVTKSATIEMLLFIIEFSPSMIREYMLKQASANDNQSSLMKVCLTEMTSDRDVVTSCSLQLMTLIRTLLDPETMSNVNETEKIDFLNFFYLHCMNVFISPLLNHSVESSNVDGISEICTVELLALILEILTFCVEHHTFHIKNFILRKDLLGHVLALLTSKHKFLVLSALRFMRKILALKDEFYNRYIIDKNLFNPILDALIINNGRYNLLQSTILEMFEFIRTEDIQSLCAYIVETFGSTLDKITYVQTFKALSRRYGQQQDRIKEKSIEGEGCTILRPGRFRRDVRQMDPEEEMWFNEDGGDVDMDEEDQESREYNRHQEVEAARNNSQLRIEFIINDKSSSESKISPLTDVDNKENGEITPQKDCDPHVSLPSTVTNSSHSISSTNSYLCRSPISSEISTNVNITTDSVKEDDGESNLRKNIENDATLINNCNSFHVSPNVVNPIKGLVDYEGDSDEDYDDEHVESKNVVESEGKVACISEMDAIIPPLKDNKHLTLITCQKDEEYSPTMTILDSSVETELPAAKRLRTS